MSSFLKETVHISKAQIKAKKRQRQAAALLTPLLALSLGAATVGTLSACGQKPDQTTLSTTSEGFKPSKIIFRYSDEASGHHHHHHHHHGKPVDARTLDPSDIKEVIKHGDHYHVVLKNGKEILTLEDPRVVGVRRALEQAHYVSNTENNPAAQAELASKRIVRVYRHGDHYHVITADGSEYITYYDPTKPHNNSEQITPVAHPLPENNNDSSEIHEIPVSPSTPSYFEPNESEDQAKTLHFHGYSPEYLVDQPISLWAHTTNDKVKSFRWTIIKADGSKIVSPVTEDHLNTHFDLSYDGASLTVESLDANGSTLEKLTKPLRIKKLGNVFISNIFGHYHTNDDINPVAISNNPDVDRFVWYLKEESAEAEHKIGEGKEVHLLGGQHLNNAIVRVEAYIGEKLLESAQATIIIHDHGNPVPDTLRKEGFAKTAASLRNNLGLNDELITAIALSRPNPDFPVGETDPELLKAYLNTVETLNLSNIPHALQYDSLKLMPHIKNLYIFKTEVNADDITALKKLPFYASLEDLRLNETKIQDMSFLSDLSTLKTLDVSGNQLSGLSFISAMPNLENFAAEYDRISDISPLSSLKKLKTLSLAGNLISDISPLAGLPLRSVSIGNNKLTSLEVFRNSPVLESISVANMVDPELYDNQIGDNHLSDLSALDGLPKLSSVYAQNAGIIDLGWTREQPKLVEINVLNNKLTNLNANLLPALERADFSHNKLSNLSLDKDLSGVSEIYLNHNNLSSIAWIEHLPNLKSLYLSNNKIASLDLAKPNYTLTLLDLNHNLLTTLKGLEKWKNVENFSATFNQITSIDNISNDSIAGIDVSSNQLTSLGNLNGFSHMTDLLVADNKIVSIKDIQSQTLRTLMIYNYEDHEQDLGGNKLSTLKGIENLPNLSEVQAYGNDDIQSINDTSSKSLENLDIAYYLPEAPDKAKFPKLSYHVPIDELPNGEDDSLVPNSSAATRSTAEQKGSAHASTKERVARSTSLKAQSGEYNNKTDNVPANSSAHIDTRTTAQSSAPEAISSHNTSSEHSDTNAKPSNSSTTNESSKKDNKRAAKSPYKRAEPSVEPIFDHLPDEISYTE